MTAKRTPKNASKRDRLRASKPTAEQLRAAYGALVPDVIGQGLRALFCGINPSLYSAAVGHHFARPGNRFWPALHAAGITPRRFDPSDDRSLLDLGYGITNVYARATATAEEVTPEQFREGARELAAKVARYQPAALAVLGIGAYRLGFACPTAVLGKQETRLHGAAVWVLPNPSGLNAHYSLEKLAALYAALAREPGG